MRFEKAKGATKLFNSMYNTTANRSRNEVVGSAGYVGLLSTLYDMSARPSDQLKAAHAHIR